MVAAHWLEAIQPFWAYTVAAGGGFALSSRLRLLGAALLGLGWGAWHAQDAVSPRLGPGCSAVELIGRVVDLPTSRPVGEADSGLSAWTFLVAPQAASTDDGLACDIAGHVRLTWFGEQAVGGGERWRLRVRLKPPRGTANEHGFDRGRWLARTKLAATGYVLDGSRLVDVDGRWATDGAVTRFRERLRQQLRLPPLVHVDVIAALTLGDTAAIPAAELERYRRTGTIHLLVISGLHVAIVTAFGFFLGRSVGLLLGLSAKAAGIVAALVLAGSYVVLAGAGLSLLRAFAMSAAAMAALAGGRTSSPSAIFAYAMAVVLALDPMAPLSIGFWLSFGAVAVLLAFFAPRPRVRSWPLSALWAQFAIVVVFAPASASITGLIHPLSMAINLVAVPAVTLFVVPVALAGVALLATPLGAWLLTAADFGIAVVAEALAIADRIAPFYVVDPGRWLPWLLLSAAACLLPLSRLAFVAVAATMAALLLVPLAEPTPAVARGEVDITVLDVGQGTAVIVETARHTLLYDVGPRFATGADSGASVVLPALRGRGRRHVDLLMLSHGDLDHVGGAASVRDGIRVDRTLAGEPVAGLDAAPCRAGARWRWDDVDFAVLSPRGGSDATGNNASCVLSIATNRARALLAGDIEKVVERRIDVAPVDFLLVPHHGSATSSSAGFVAVMQPTFAVVAAGFDNRFGHPHQGVLERYRDVGAHIVSTAVSGALRWRSDNPAIIEPVRHAGSPYWR